MRLGNCYIVLCLFSFLMLTGCEAAGQHEKIQETTGQETVEDAWSIEAPGQYQYESDTLTMDFEISIPTSVSRYKVNAKTIDFSSYGEKLLADVMPDTEYEYSESDGFDMDGNDILWKSWSKELPGHYWTQIRVSGLFLECVINPYNSMADTRMNDALRLYNDDCYFTYPEHIRNNESAFIGKTFDFGSPQDGIHSFFSTLEAAGIETNGDFSYVCYGMDAQTAEQEWYAEDPYGNPIDSPDFSDFADRYYILARQSYKDLPVLYYTFSTEILDTDPSTMIRIVFSESGLDGFVIEKMFTFEKTDELWDKFIDFNQAAEAVQANYENILLSNHYRIEKAGLYYYASRKGDSQEYELIPAWVFQVDEYSGSGQYIGTKPCIIDAVTGLEMEYKK